MKHLQRNLADTLHAYDFGIESTALADYVCLSKEHLKELKHACYINSVGYSYACKLIYKLHDLGKSLQRAYEIIFNNIGAFNTNYARKTFMGAWEIRNYYLNRSYFYLGLEQAKTRFRNEIFNQLSNIN